MLTLERRYYIIDYKHKDEGEVSMASLGAYLLNRCYRALTDSSLVDSRDRLAFIFNTRDLNLHRFRIPDADNAEERAEKIITMLLGKNTEEEGPQLFLVFLRFATTRFPKEGEWPGELSECCALVEIEHVLRSMGSENEYDIRDIAELVAHFHNHPYVDESTYNRVLRLLSPEIVGNVRERLRDFDIPAVVRILIACLSTPDGVGQLAWALYHLNHETEEWPKLDSLVRKLCKVDVTYARLQQLQLLLEPLKLPANVLLNAYRASAPEISAIPAGDEEKLLPMMLAKLGKLPDTDNVLPILEFAKRLAQCAEQQHRQDIQRAVESWIEARVRELGKNIPQCIRALDARLQDPAPAPVAYLLIVVERLQDEQIFEIRAWLLDDQNQPAEKTQPQTKPERVPSEGIPECINKIYGKYKAYASDELLIEVFLSTEDLLCCAIDRWPIDGKRAKRKFGIMHRLVVRSLERTQYVEIQRVWTKKWEVFQKFKQSGNFVDGLFWLCEEQNYINGDALFTDLDISPVVCLTMGFVPSSPDETDILTAILETGIPIVLWPRVSMKSLKDSFDKFKEQLKELFQSPQKLEDLPYWVFEQRRAALKARDDHHGHHLTLLWDDPNRLPPGTQLVAPNREGVL